MLFLALTSFGSDTTQTTFAVPTELNGCIVFPQAPPNILKKYRLCTSRLNVAIQLLKFWTHFNRTPSRRFNFLISPNGSGKTAGLQALCRMFALDPSLRRIKKSDFHVPYNETEIPEERPLWIEADFQFHELTDEAGNTIVAPHFGHMRLDDNGDGIPRVRFRLVSDSSLKCVNNLKNEKW
ncbi:hypothetical protein [Shewanella sp. VB17]|uniref:hypothetical protein n=1 Tax=Shewanella sp. VB17 TaxID=2739432 RepID=UPI0020B8443B|nr:hypothetical protein [Shewanella sp. VB17]